MAQSVALSEKIIELVIDKVLLGSIVLAAGYWLNKRLEIFKNKTNQENLQKQLIAELENQLAISQYNAELEFIERQISEFYWPIYLRLEKDNVMWERIERLSAEKNVLPEAVSKVIEKEFILKNHQEIVEIIESKIHLVGDFDNSKKFIDELLKYIKHVEVYKTIRSIKKFRRFNPIDLKEPFPEDLFKLVKDNFQELQNTHEDLKYEHLNKAKFSKSKNHFLPGVQTTYAQKTIARP